MPDLGLEFEQLAVCTCPMSDNGWNKTLTSRCEYKNVNGTGGAEMPTNHLHKLLTCVPFDPLLGLRSLFYFARYSTLHRRTSFSRNDPPWDEVMVPLSCVLWKLCTSKHYSPIFILYLFRLICSSITQRILHSLEIFLIKTWRWISISSFCSQPACFSQLLLHRIVEGKSVTIQFKFLPFHALFQIEVPRSVFQTA